MKTLIATLILFFTLSVIASAAEPYNREAEPVLTKKWKTTTVEMPFKQVVRILKKQKTICGSGNVLLASVTVVPYVDDELGEAEFITVMNSFGIRKKSDPIKIYALTVDTTQIMWTLKRTGKQVHGWLNGSVKCNGKLPKGSDDNS